jgi:hypothetical protein
MANKFYLKIIKVIASVCAAVGISLLILFTVAVLNAMEDQNKNKSENKIIPVKAFSIHEDALGMTEKNMDIAFINKFDLLQLLSRRI